MQGSSASPLGGTGGRDRLAESFGTSAQLRSQHERAKTSPSVFHRPSWRPCLRGATCQQSHPILPSGLNRKLSRPHTQGSGLQWCVARREQTMSSDPKPMSLVFSYSHRDEDLLDGLREHLGALKRQ